MARGEEKAPATYTNTVNIQGAATLDSTLTVSSTATVGGLLTAGTGLTATTGPITVTAGDLVATEGTLDIKNGTTVTQSTSKSTTVVSNTEAGKITMNAAQLNTDTAVTFQVTCSKARATDVCIVNHHSGGTVGAYVITASGHDAGHFDITVRNITGGNLSQALVLHYALIKTVHS